jgi:hypothetical protein
MSCEVKSHRSNRCGDFAAYEDHHLRRREDSSSSVKLYDEWQRLMLVYRVAHPGLARYRSRQRASPKGKSLSRDLPRGDYLVVDGTGGVLRQRCIIRIHGISADDPLERLPPRQTRGIPGFHSKTPVAQMPFVSELPLSQGDQRINNINAKG